MGRGCGDIWVGFSGHRFSTRLAEIININKGEYTKWNSQPGFYRCDGDGAGTQAQTWLVAAYRPAGGAPSVNRRCPERGANPASTGVATIVQGSSSLVHPGTDSQLAGGIPRMNRGTPRTNCTNLASTGVVNDVRKCNRPGFCRCGRGGCSRRFCAGEGATTRDKGLPLPLYPRRDFNQDLSGRCQLGFYQCGSDFGAKGRMNSHQFSLRFRLGRDQRTTPGRRRQPKFL